jgi:hypothetical protein
MLSLVFSVLMMLKTIVIWIIKFFVSFHRQAPTPEELAALLEDSESYVLPSSVAASQMGSLSELLEKPSTSLHSSSSHISVWAPVPPPLAAKPKRATRSDDENL